MNWRHHNDPDCGCGAPPYIHELFNAINELGEAMTGIQASIDADTAEVTALSSSVGDIITGIDDLKAQLAAAGVQPDTTALDAALANLQTQVNTATADVTPSNAPSGAPVVMPPADNPVTSTDPANAENADPGMTPDPTVVDHPDDQPADASDVGPVAETDPPSPVGADGIPVLTDDISGPAVTGEPTEAAAVPAVTLAITDPADGAVLATSSVSLSGTGPDGSVVVYDGQATIGSASATGGTWQTAVTLGDGEHDLWVGQQTDPASEVVQSAHVKVTVNAASLGN